MIKIKNYTNGKLVDTQKLEEINIYNPSTGKIYATCKK